jgi:hypothetical protein
MDRAMIVAHLAQAKEHVASGERQIARQREIVAEMERDGHYAVAKSARDLLRKFEELQVEHVSHRDRLLKELAKISN